MGHVGVHSDKYIPKKQKYIGIAHGLFKEFHWNTNPTAKIDQDLAESLKIFHCRSLSAISRS